LLPGHPHVEVAGGEPRSVPVRGLTRAIRVKIASERGEFEQAFQLLSERYKARGLEAPDARKYRYTEHHTLPGTVTFVALEADRVVATLSLVPDNTALGLPMECIYAEEVDSLRRRGRRLGEVISLAEDGLSYREFLRVFGALIRMMGQYHVRQGGDAWVIAVNPRHRDFYCRVHGFVPLGPRRAYSAVQDNPAEALELDMESMRERVPAKYHEYFGEPIPRSVLTPLAWPADFAHEFGADTAVGRRRTTTNARAAGVCVG
jgi:hypothetical protein